MPRSLTFFLSLSLFIISFLQIPIFAASFDCKKAETQTEKVICGDKELSQMDEDLSDIYFSSLLLKYSESDQEQKKIIKKIKQDQVDWIKVDQTSCEGNIACLKNIYSRRIESFKFLEILEIKDLEKHAEQYLNRNKWKLVSIAKGDLNGDGDEDIAIVWKDTDPKKLINNSSLGRKIFDKNRSAVSLLYTNEQIRNRKGIVNYKLIPPQQDSCHDDYFNSIEIEDKVLKLGLRFWTSCGSYYVGLYNYLIESISNNFVLSKYEASGFYRNGGTGEKIVADFREGYVIEQDSNPLGIGPNESEEDAYRRLHTRSCVNIFCPNVFRFPANSFNKFEELEDGMLLPFKNIANIKDADGRTALHYASKYQLTGLVSKLIFWNAEINSTDNFNETPLHFASEGGHVNIIKMLLDNGADITVKNNIGDTAFDLAKSNYLIKDDEITEKLKP